MPLLEIVGATVAGQTTTDVDEIAELRKRSQRVRYLSRARAAAIARESGQEEIGSLARGRTVLVIDQGIVYRRWDPIAKSAPDQGR